MSERGGVSLTTVNVVSSFASYGLSLVIAIAYTPFLIEKLGLAAFSLIALTFALVQYAGPISQTISAAANQRMVAASSDTESFNQIFSTVATLSLVGAGLFLALAFAVSPALGLVLNIPSDLSGAAISLFLAAAGAFAFAFAATPLSGLIFSSNKIYILNIKNSVETIIRVMIVVCLFWFVSVSLEHVALAICISSALGVLMLGVASILVRKDLHYHPKKFSREVARSMMFTGGGMGLVQIGSLLIVYSDLLVVNLAYGPEVAGAYAAASQWSLVLKGLVTSVGITVMAHVMLEYNRLEGSDRIESLAQAVRFYSAFGGLPVGFIAGVSPYLLTIWVGPELSNQSLTLMVLALAASMTCIIVPVQAAMLAADQIGSIGWGYLIVGLAFPIVALLATNLGWGGIEVAIVMAFFLAAITYCLFIPKAGKAFGNDAGRVLRTASFYTIRWTLLATGLTALISFLLQPQGFLALFGIGLAVCLIYPILAFGSMPSRDRSFISRIVNQSVMKARSPA